MIRLYLTRLTLPAEPEKRYSASSEGARRLLAWALKEQGIDPSKHPLSRTPEGKPYLADGSVEISISHSGPWAVCVLSDTSVGVDVELIRPVSAGVWKKYLAQTPDESCGDGHEAILRWTRYEAALKRLGHPSPFPDGVEFTTFRALPGYLLTVCGAGQVETVRFVSERRIFTE